MDFNKVLSIVIKEFRNQKVRYALMGGFGISALGVVRATIDIDFLVSKSDCGKIQKILENIGYKLVFNDENVSQYTSSSNTFGEIDFIHAFRKTSVEMIQRAREMDLFDGTLKINVLLPEDIIGLKLQAMLNNPSRENKEISDIELLMEHYKSKLNWNLIREHYLLFDKEKDFLALKDKYEKLK